MDDLLHVAQRTMHAVFSSSQYNILAPDQGEHSREIPLITKDKVLHSHLTKVSPDVGGPGTGNDRWLHEMVTQHGSKHYAWLHTHVNAVIQNHDPKSSKYLYMLDNHRMHVTADAMVTIEARAKEYLRDSDIFAVKVTGDFNILPVIRGQNPADAAAWEYSPQEMFKRLNMWWVNSRVVYYGATKNLMKVHVTEVPPGTPKNRSDHGRLVVVTWPRPLSRGK